MSSIDKLWSFFIYRLIIEKSDNALNQFGMDRRIKSIQYKYASFREQVSKWNSKIQKLQGGLPCAGFDIGVLADAIAETVRRMSEKHKPEQKKKALFCRAFRGFWYYFILKIYGANF